NQISFGAAAGEPIFAVSVIGNDFGSRGDPVHLRENAYKLVWLGNWDSSAHEEVGEGLHINGYYVPQQSAIGIGLGIVSGQELRPKNSLEGAVAWIGSVSDTEGKPIVHGTVALIGRSDVNYAEAAVLVGKHPTNNQPYTAQRWGGAAGVPGVPGAA